MEFFSLLDGGYQSFAELFTSILGRQDPINALIFLMALWTFIVHGRRWRYERQLARDNEFLDQAIHSLEWAWMILTDSGKNIPPLADRLNWLTAARMLCRYKVIARNIVTKEYQDLLSEQEEYWRHKFYVVLDNSQVKNFRYFLEPKPEGGDVFSFGYWPENIELKSAYVINQFAGWNEEYDILEKVDIANFGRTPGPISFALDMYKEEIEGYKKKMMEDYENDMVARRAAD